MTKTDTGPGTMSPPEISSREKRRRFFPWIIIALVIVFAIPLGLVVMGLATGPVTGRDECSHCGEPITDFAPAVRAGPDSLHIVMQPDPSKHHTVVPTVRIYVNDRDVSNQSLIAASKADLVISPGEGLVFESGSSVTLRGSAVAGNAGNPIHLRIITTYPDTGRRITIGEQLF